MKHLIVVISLIISKFAYPQSLPVDFKFSPKINFSAPNNRVSSNLPVKIILNQFAAPVSSPTIISNFISDIIVAGDTIWFGTGKGISRTVDNGASFQNYYGTSPFGEDDVSGIAIYGNYVVVGTAFSQEINGENIPTGSGIKVSSDYGITWNSYPQPTDAQNDTIIVYGSNNIRALAITAVEQNLSYDIL
ncbi:MAG: hypothetical protein ACRDFC_03380, partial [Ignavibacteria bacterium]